MENNSKKLNIRVFGAADCTYCKRFCEEMFEQRSESKMVGSKSFKSLIHLII